MAPDPTEPSDEQLMAECSARRSRAAFETLVGRWEARLFAYLAKATANPEDALDLRQEVFLRLWRHREGYRHDAPFAHWLFRIASNTVKDWQRRRRRRPETSLDWMRECGWTEPADAQPHPNQAAAVRQRREALLAALATLAPEQRQLILLRFHEGCTFAAISGILQLPETTLKSRLYRLLAQLRDELARRGHSPIEVGP